MAHEAKAIFAKAFPRLVASEQQLDTFAGKLAKSAHKVYTEKTKELAFHDLLDSVNAESREQSALNNPAKAKFNIVAKEPPPRAVAKMGVKVAATTPAKVMPKVPAKVLQKAATNHLANVKAPPRAKPQGL
eukprot:GEMP01098111.1.p1 GENE.GEMP01098111.1~~GEMP01098111.1.p1  ORF type:complete len:131 (+),score=23.18 GEMP01098111.1:350-742(+)